MRFVLTCRLALPMAGLLIATAAAGAEVDYLRDIKPIFEKRCYACHGVLKQNGSLRLDTAAAMKEGGDSGAAIADKNPADSLIVQVITGEAGYRMPPEGEGAPLTADEIEKIRQWIAAGAAAPADELPQQDPHAHWSYRPVQRPELPAVANAAWIRTPIDAFLAAQHERLQLVPRPEADKATLLRRVYIDLIGIPPTPAELHTFLADESPLAYERVVDQLLESPLYGQRWGRHWMDVWRYSDWYGSRGIDQVRYGQRHSWRWRDWIVESLNADKGYDQMVQEMLAGDELAPQDADTVRATGYLGRNWYMFDRNVWLFDTVEHSAQAFLGLTLRCARCHDHKFDPISQRDYYRYRAYFEPHDVRIDPLRALVAPEKEGLSLVYDKQLDAPTYLFARGDGRYPEKDEPLEPGVPEAFGLAAVPVEPVALPKLAAFPYLRPEILAGLREHAQNQLQSARDQVAERERAITTARENLEAFVAAEASGQLPPARTPLFADDFSTANNDVWKAASGAWRFADGLAILSEPGHFSTLQSNFVHPQSFALRVRYKPTAAGTLHSVGVFFDSVELRDAQAVYTAITENGSSVQAFHRQGSVEHYPAAGIHAHPLKLNEPITLDLAARGSQLNVWVNGQLAIAYRMPMARQQGTLALWCHAGSAEFDEVVCEALPDEFALAQQLSDPCRSPFDAPTREQYEFNLAEAERLRARQQPVIAAAEQEVATLEARIAADNARAEGLPEEQAAALARAAALAERTLADFKAQLALTEAEQALAAAQQAAYGDEAAKNKAVTDAQAKLDEARKTAEQAKQALTTVDEKYTPIGPSYPTTSTGRRLALARWITHRDNPRTARIAVNHLWLRHFGEALVPTTANFGLNGSAPSHPELLDWLAAELMDQGWRMKPLHRLLVTSTAYRMSSTEGDAVENLERDPANRYLWRMNSRQAEAEVVRDSLLYVAGMLDVTPGGPELPETEGLTSRRRTLYFRNTPNEKMQLLESFDLANPNACYRRQVSVLPQQALALTNSVLALNVARQLAATITRETEQAPVDQRDAQWLDAVFERILCRAPTDEEQAACRRFLERHAQLLQTTQQQPFPATSGNLVPPSTDPAQQARENLVHVLLNHNDFVTVR